MKYFSILIILDFIFIGKIFPQLQFTRHTITNAEFLAQSVYAVDLDNDGHIDVVAAFAQDFTGKIIWFENTWASRFYSPRNINKYGGPLVCLS